jgi:hypothetical protein
MWGTCCARTFAAWLAKLVFLSLVAVVGAVILAPSSASCTGRDRLVGGAGRDRLLGGAGRDICIGGPGRDRARCP